MKRLILLTLLALPLVAAAADATNVQVTIVVALDNGNLRTNQITFSPGELKTLNANVAAYNADTNNVTSITAAAYVKDLLNERITRMRQQWLQARRASIQAAIISTTDDAKLDAVEAVAKQ